MLNVVTIVGARPQFIKASILSQIIKDRSDIKESIIHTGQHYDSNMSKVFFEQLEISQPDYNLGIGSGNHGRQTGKMLEAIEDILQKEKPDLVLVYGDTNSTLAGALAASKLQIPLAHVEAGLRSFNRNMPEEINRVLTDHVSDYLFAPTETAVANLNREGLPENRIFLVGDVMYDATLKYGEKAERGSNIIERLQLKPKEFMLATVHRQENTDNSARLRIIFDGLNQVAQSIRVILPLHPRTRKALDRDSLLKAINPDVLLTDPVGYLDMLKLEKNARLILTDSGGVQKESYFFRVPCITLRKETEWTELLQHGFNRLGGDSAESINLTVQESLKNKNLDWTKPLYGDGNSAEAITNILIKQ